MKTTKHAMNNFNKLIDNFSYSGVDMTDFKEMPANFTYMDSDIEDIINYQIISQSLVAKKSVFQREFKLATNRFDFLKWAESIANHTHIQFSNYAGIAVNSQRDISGYFIYRSNDRSIHVNVYGDMLYVDHVEKLLKDNFEMSDIYINWVYDKNGQSINVPLELDNVAVDEMYPWLGEESLADYWDRYMDSKANILLLIGPPGTGKTTFIRSLLKHANKSAMITYDPDILNNDSIFCRFIEGSEEFMVIEDSDQFLQSRTDGNTMMFKFLNVGDGLISSKDKKLIFSTNLPSIRDIDPALIRPGRCFDVVEFNLLNWEQAKKVADRFDIQLTREPGKKEWTIAEIFNTTEFHTTSANRRLGF